MGEKTGIASCVFGLGVQPVCVALQKSLCLSTPARKPQGGGNRVWIFWEKQENKPTHICKPKLFFICFYFIVHKYFSTPAFSEDYFKE